MKIGQITRKKGVHSRTFKYSKNEGSAYHFTYVLRAPKEKRELIAKGMEYAIQSSKHIRYNNGSKSGKLYDLVKRNHFDCRGIFQDTYTNCCDLASVCARYAGLETPRHNSSLTLHKKWVNFGFKRLKYKEGMKLYRGDVLVSTGKKPHTVVVL